jgi:hypothetical protein
MYASIRGHLERVRALLEAGADVAQATTDGCTALMAASRAGHVECVRMLVLEAGTDVAQAAADGWTALMYASLMGHVGCVHALLAAGANVAQAAADGMTALMVASEEGRLDCMRALLEAGANVMQLRIDGTCALEFACRHPLEMLQLLCAYSPSRAEVRAHPMPTDLVLPECVEWLDETSRWASPLHHFEFLPTERVRALLVAGADVRASDGEANAPTPLSLAEARLLQGDRLDDDSHAAAALIVRAAAPWSPRTHALFPTTAKARAVELLRIGWLLARHLQGLLADTTQVEVAYRDVWLSHIMRHAISRSRSS